MPKSRPCGCRCRPSSTARAERSRAASVTRIVIAHRLSTIAGADRIVVLEGGRIVQAGSYFELLEQPGVFVALAAAAHMITPAAFDTAGVIRGYECALHTFFKLGFFFAGLEITARNLVELLDGDFFDDFFLSGRFDVFGHVGYLSRR